MSVIDDRNPLEDAITRHYARQQEGLPPPVFKTEHLRRPYTRWLNEYFPVPRPLGGWVEPIPSFEWWLEHRWPELQTPFTAASAFPVPERPALADTAPEESSSRDAPVQQTLPLGD